jgi:hypothetical protein
MKKKTKFIVNFQRRALYFLVFFSFYSRTYDLYLCHVSELLRKRVGFIIIIF